MSNLGPESLAGMLKSGSPEGFGTGSVTAPVAPEGLAIRAMEQEGMKASPAEAGNGAKGFGQMLTESIEKVNDYQQQADTSIKELAAGRTKNIHETMLAIEKADTSLKLMMQVRNKVLDAYKEIIRMQV